MSTILVKPNLCLALIGKCLALRSIGRLSYIQKGSLLRSFPMANAKTISISQYSLYFTARTPTKNLSLSQVSQLSILPKDFVCYTKQTQTPSGSHGLAKDAKPLHLYEGMYIITEAFTLAVTSATSYFEIINCFRMKASLTEALFRSQGSMLLSRFRDPHISIPAIIRSYFVIFKHWFFEIQDPSSFTRSNGRTNFIPKSPTMMMTTTTMMTTMTMTIAMKTMGLIIEGQPPPTPPRRPKPECRFLPESNRKAIAEPNLLPPSKMPLPVPVMGFSFYFRRSMCSR